MTKKLKIRQQGCFIALFSPLMQLNSPFFTEMITMKTRLIYLLKSFLLSACKQKEEKLILEC